MEALQVRRVPQSADLANPGGKRVEMKSRLPTTRLPHQCYPKNMRVAIACCVAFALLGMASGLALVNCPFLVSSDHPSCCHNKYAPKKCPLSNSFETCPYVPLDAKIDHGDAKLTGTPPPAIGLDLPVVSVGSMETTPVAWIPSLTDLHIRIRVLLI